MQPATADYEGLALAALATVGVPATWETLGAAAGLTEDASGYRWLAFRNTLYQLVATGKVKRDGGPTPDALYSLASVADAR
jgi:hypothetical protein